MNRCFLSDEEWRDLLREIHNRQVIPVVGPELSMSDDRDGGKSLYRVLAPKLATALKLPWDGAPPVSFNGVACQHLLSGGRRKEIYQEVAELLDRFKASPHPALCDLASITDFDLYVSGAIDPLLSLAMEKCRPGFDRKRHVRAYDYKRPVDIPEDLGDAFVYHLLGNRQTYPNFAIWEEDYLEFICGLMQHHAQLERFFLLLKTRYLLLLGAPFADWLVRFFLFVVKGGRFSDHHRDDVQAYLTDHEENLGEPLIFFFDKVVGTTKIIRGDPADFSSELAGRWRAEYESSSLEENVLAQMPREMPRGAVFISYSRDDLEAVTNLVRGLRTAQVPVWIDKQRLQAGTNYEQELKFAVMNGCSFFISVISRATERDPERFVHTERHWAAQRHVDGYVFYIPVVIDEDIVQPKLEPPEFSRIHFDRLPGGEVGAPFATRVSDLVKKWRSAGQPHV